MSDAIQMSAEFGVFRDDVSVADVDEDVETERLEIGGVFPPSRVVELKAITASFFLVGDVQDFDAVLLGENSTLVFVVGVFVVFVVVVTIVVAE